MSNRGPWQGMMTIIRFNWPFYLTAVVVAAMALAGMIWLESGWWKSGCGFLLAGAMYFLIISSGISHWVYDRSDLYRWKWLSRALGDGKVEDVVLCHAGFDEVSGALRGRFPNTAWVVLDHYDEATMSEPSIQRARRLFPPTADTLSAAFDRWPMADGSADAVLGLLAIHELRSEDERTAWFAEARRCLRPDGRVVVAEHTRDAANFLAFGPGFLHFHSVASWRRSWERAGLRLADGFHVTPWIRIFVLTSP
jgi:SAM-dependent methyltransferase